MFVGSRSTAEEDSSGRRASDIMVYAVPCCSAIVDWLKRERGVSSGAAQRGLVGLELRSSCSPIQTYVLSEPILFKHNQDAEE